MLEQRGWTVLGCSDPVVALQTAIERGGDFSCLITDYSMPGMTGLELAKQVHAVHPTLPIILSTGFLEHEDLVRSADSGITQVLPKPFTARDLTRVLREAVPSA
jgi:CheY-like chemotaxis protein